MRVSATNLEAFRRWKADDEQEIGDLLAQLRRENPPSEAMRAGSALHKILELAKPGDTLETVTRDGFTFEFEADGDLQIPACRELKFEIPRVINGEPVTLVCVVDTVDGLTVEDHKTTARPDAENYTESAQWKCYLSWLACDLFRYNLFHVYQPEARPGVYIVKDVVQIEFARYPGMNDEVDALTAEFLAFCKEHAPDLYSNERKAA